MGHVQSGFVTQLERSWQRNNSLLCVGLDPDLAEFPATVPRNPDGVLAFNRAIVDATHDLVCAYKPQIAFFSSIGAERALEQTIAYIHDTCPGIPVILDAKRGDVESTAVHYAREAFERYHADAVTVNPWLGRDAVEPFLGYADRGIFVLCRTSNPGAGDFQDLDIGGDPLYLRVARQVAQNWNDNGNCALVVGATWPRQLGEIRGAVGDMPILVPGVGAQGGDIGQVIDNGRTANGTGLIVSSSRSILYAGASADFAKAARDGARSLRHRINQYRR